MVRLWWCLIVSGGFTSITCAQAEPLQQALALQKTMQQVIERCEKTVASIVVSRSDQYRLLERRKNHSPGQLGRFDAKQFQPEFQPKGRRKLIESLDLKSPRNVPEAYGSGVVVSKDGQILTNAHVVDKATKIYVRLPGGGGSYANIHALDPRSDLAILTLIDAPRNLHPVVFGDGDAVKKGQFVVAISNPYSLGFVDGSPSASQGMVSNLRRRLPGYTSETQRHELSLHHFGTLIQSDVRLQAGCSGGALFDLEGKMIGLISAQAALTGLDSPGGFALPMSRGLKRVISMLQEGKEVEYGFLGVQFSLQQRSDVKVPHLDHVIPGSPASRGGLKSGDYIYEVDGKSVHSHDDLFLALGLHLAGEKVKIIRSAGFNGIKKTVEVTLGKFYLPRQMIASDRPKPRAGLRVDYPTTVVQGYWPSSKAIPRGVRVREVVKKSSADRATLQENDVILSVNGRSVVTPDEFYEAMDRANGSARLRVDRGKNRIDEIPLRWTD